MDDHSLLLISNSGTTPDSDESIISASSTGDEPTASTTTTEMPSASSNCLRMRNQPVNRKQTVGIIGTGDYARALVKRLTTLAGCDVIIGSRKPQLRRRTLSATLDLSISGVKLASIEDCVAASDIVLVAIHWEDFKVTLMDVAHLFAGKIVVDVTNRDTRNVPQSNAEYLASILRSASVVKAFNSVSAYAMEDIGNAGDSSAVAYVAGNDLGAREKVMTLAQAMGFRPVNLGVLSSARWMEDCVLSVFSLWKWPVVVATSFFTLFSMVILYKKFIKETPRPDLWEQLFLMMLNKSICFTAIVTLALTYFPGQLAGILQVYYGTKHRRFPQFLDTWLKCRKQMGLVTFFLATLHAIMSITMMSPSYFHSWYHEATVTVPANTTFTSDLVLTPTRQLMTWKGEAASLLGILAFVLMGIIALTSIRSIGDSLNWSEWRWVQSHLGYVVLAVASAHVIVMAYRSWWKKGFPKILNTSSFWSAVPAFVTLAMKLVFSLPPLSGRLHKIRRGWERKNAKYDVDTSNGNANILKIHDDSSCDTNDAFMIGSTTEETSSPPGVNVTIAEDATFGKTATERRGNESRSVCGLEQFGASSGQPSLLNLADGSSKRD